METNPVLRPAEVVRQLTDAFNSGDFDLGMRYIADNAVNHGPPPTSSLEEWRRTWVSMRAAFPDIHARVEQVIEEGDTVCRRIRISGTNTGGDAPTGRRFETLGMDMVRVHDGKVVEHWALLDAAGMAAQLAGTEV
jgi:predicted ester cyclase